MVSGIFNQDAIKKCVITLFFLFLFAVNLSDELGKLNRIIPPYTLEVGQKIRLSPMENKPSDAVGKKTDDTIAPLLYDAQNGDSDAQLKLGWFYFSGDNFHKDYEKGIAWLQKSADQIRGTPMHKIDLERLTLKE